MGFLDLLGPFWLCLAAPVWAVSRPVLGSGPPGVFDSLRSPWGAGYCRGGCARAARGGHFGAVLLAPFFGQNAGAALRAPVPWRVQGRVRGPAGGCLPFRSRWPSPPASGATTARRLKSADSNDHIDVVLTNTLERRAAYPSTCAVGEHRVRARPDGGRCLPSRSWWPSRPGSGCRHSALRCGVALLLFAALFW